jgi:GT2 family glycosyltransferase
MRPAAPEGEAMTRGKVSVCVLFNGGYKHAEFEHALDAAFSYDSTLPDGDRLFHPYEWRIGVGGTDDVARKRNRGIEAFLTTGSEWLVFIDDDEVFDRDTIHRLIASAHPTERPVISALVMVARKSGNITPGCVSWDGAQFREYHEISPTELWQVGAVGAGFLAIHRSVLEAMAEKHATDAWPWFKFAQRDTAAGPDVMGEDYVFALRVQALGYPVFVNTRIHVGHIKTRILWPRDMWNQQPPQALPLSNVAVIPVKDNLNYTASLIKQLKADEDCHEIVVVDNGSTAKTRKWLDKAGVTVLDAPGQGIHRMWNMGAAHAMQYYPRANVCFLNNDIRVGDRFMGAMSGALNDGPPDLIAVCPNYDGRTGAGVERLNGICAERYDGSGGLAGFAYMVRGEWFQTGYRFPEDCMWWYGDNDLLFSIEMAGGWYGMTHATTVEHLDGGGRTGEWDNPEMQAQLGRDRKAFEVKWSKIMGQTA